MSEGPTQPITGMNPQPFPPPRGGGMTDMLDRRGGGGLSQEHNQLHGQMEGQIGQPAMGMNPAFGMQAQPAVMPAMNQQPYGQLGGLGGQGGQQTPLAGQIPKVTGGIK